MKALIVGPGKMGRAIEALLLTGSLVPLIDQEGRLAPHAYDLLEQWLAQPEP